MSEMEQFEQARMKDIGNVENLMGVINKYHQQYLEKSRASWLSKRKKRKQHKKAVKYMQSSCCCYVLFYFVHMHRQCCQIDVFCKRLLHVVCVL